ncbi:MAG: hypothetical protein GC184_01295 [Rhizobiales bacterium]|nr:hypothetical protein [Hyphomicrobiales bacterium]
MDKITPSIDVDIRIAWKKADPDIMADARDLWRRLSVLPETGDVDFRADEIVVAAYVGDRLAGVATAFVRELEFLRHKFFMLRGLVSPDFRQHQLARLMLAHSYGVLKQWSMDHPEEKVMGAAGVLQSSALTAKKRPPSSPVGAFVLMGYTPTGEQIRVSWFDHVVV